jgi:hypothetical protein
MARSRGTRIGTGAGWGGPAKGAGSGTKPAFTVDTPTRQTIPNASSPGKGDPVKRAARRDQKELDLANAQMLKNMLFGLAKTADTAMGRIRAAEAWLNRAEGMPIARSIAVVTDDIKSLSDDALRAELENLGGASSADTEGDAPPRVPSQPASVVH